MPLGRHKEVSETKPSMKSLSSDFTFTDATFDLVVARLLSHFVIRARYLLVRACQLESKPAEKSQKEAGEEPHIDIVPYGSVRP